MKTGFLCRAATAIALFSLNPAHARNLGADGGERYVQCDWQAARFELTLGRNQGKAVLYRIGAGSWTEYDFSTKRFVARTCEQIDESAVDRCEPEVNGTIYSFTGYSGNALAIPLAPASGNSSELISRAAPRIGSRTATIGDRPASRTPA